MMSTSVILLLILFLFTFTSIKAELPSDTLPVQTAKTSESENIKLPVEAMKHIQLSGYTHMRYQFFEEKGKPNGFDIRRARLDLKGALASKLTYRLLLDFVSSPSLLEAYGEYKVNSGFIITAGQIKVPLTLESNTSELAMQSVDRSQVVEALAGRTKDVIGNQVGRDIGIQVSGKILPINEISLLEYQIGLFNGSGINTGDNNNSKDIAGRIIIHPLKGIDIGSSFYSGTGYYGNPKTNHTRNRFGLDMAADFSDFSFRTEYLQGKDSSINRNGYYIQLGYFIFPKKLQCLVKYDSYDPNLDVNGDKSKYYIFGLNYIIVPNNRIQFNYTVRKEEVTEKKNNYAVVQFQLAF